MKSDSPNRSGAPWTLVKVLAGANALLIVIAVFLGVKATKLQTEVERISSAPETTPRSDRPGAKVTQTPIETTSGVNHTLHNVATGRPRRVAQPVDQSNSTRGATPDQIADALNGSREASTFSRMRRISTMIQMYFAENDNVPGDLTPLGLSTEDLVDGWTHTMRYEKTGDRAFRIVSSGADGSFGTGDDLVCADGRFTRGSGAQQIAK